MQRKQYLRGIDFIRFCFLLLSLSCSSIKVPPIPEVFDEDFLSMSEKSEYSEDGIIIHDKGENKEFYDIKLIDYYEFKVEIEEDKYLSDKPENFDDAQEVAEEIVEDFFISEVCEKVSVEIKEEEGLFEGSSEDKYEETVCIPNCINKECGDDGCGGSCGKCGEGKNCINFKCSDCPPICDTFDVDNLCKPCLSHSDCEDKCKWNISVCIQMGEQGSFCGIDCSNDGKCPSNYKCVTTKVEQEVFLAQCLPQDMSCPCTKQFIGLKAKCYIENQFGRCYGERVCTENGYTPCSAKTPSKEVCDNQDNNCDGQVDEGACLPKPEWLFAMPKGSGKIYLGWKMLKDHPEASYNIYRSDAKGGPYTKVNPIPISDSTNYIDTTVANGKTYYYIVRGTNENNIEGESSNEVSVTASNSSSYLYKSFSGVFTADPGKERSVNIKVNDIDGDGMLDYLFQATIADKGGENLTSMGVVIFSHDGKKLLDIPTDFVSHPNGAVESVAWTLWDMDGDGKSEIIARDQIDGTVYVQIRNGLSGSVIKQAPWPEWIWVSYIGIAYIDGKNPHIITQSCAYPGCPNTVTAFDKDLNIKWKSIQYTTGAHGLKIADIDYDGKDEIMMGALLIDHDGKHLWFAGEGNIDRMEVDENLIPSLPGYEIYLAFEQAPQGYGIWDGKGKKIWQASEDAGDKLYCCHTHMGWCADVIGVIDGMECYIVCHPECEGQWKSWIVSSKNGNVVIPPNVVLGAPINWTGDEQREMYFANGILQRFNNSMKTYDVTTLGVWGDIFIADIIGDYREEVIVVEGTQWMGYSGKVYIFTNTELNNKKRMSPWDDRRYRQDKARTTTHLY